MAALLEDKIVLVTGASSGIGRETAIVMAGHGAKLVVAARREADLAETVDLIESEGGTASYAVTDVSDAAQVERAVQHAVSTFGGLNAAFNNAGILEPNTRLHEVDEDDFDSIINVNLKGTFLSMKYEIAHMIENSGGAIVNDSSFMGLRGGTGRQAAYTASKHGVIGLTKAASRLRPARHSSERSLPRGDRYDDDARTRPRGRSRNSRQDGSMGSNEPLRQSERSRAGRCVLMLRRRQLRHRPGNPSRRRRDQLA